MLADLLRRPGVEEHCELRTRFGFMAYHGGALEKVTDVIAREAAERAGWSYYGVTQSLDPLHHIRSIDVSPDGSATLASFLDHVDAVATIHGYGREHMRYSLLLGGRNRSMADHFARVLDDALSGYDVVADLDAIPAGLRGQHAANPVNLPRHHGVQIELPPTIRWHMEGWHWSDRGALGRAEDTERLIAALASAAVDWARSG